MPGKNTSQIYSIFNGSYLLNLNSNDSGYVIQIKPGLKFTFLLLKEDECFETKTGDDGILNYLGKLKLKQCQSIKIFLYILVTILITN